MPDYQDVPISQGFDNSGLGVGHARITKEALEIFKEYPEDFIFAPGFVVKKQDEDGTIMEAELIEISMIPARQYVDWYKHNRDQR